MVQDLTAEFRLDSSSVETLRDRLRRAVMEQNELQERARQVNRRLAEHPEEAQRLQNELADINRRTDRNNDLLRQSTREWGRFTEGAREARTEVRGLNRELADTGIPEAAPGAAGGITGFLGGFGQLAALGGLIRGGRTGLIVGGLGAAAAAGGTLFTASQSAREAERLAAREASERGVVPGEVRQAERIFRQRGIVGFEETEAGEAVFEVTREAARNIAERGEEIRQGLTDIGVSLTETDRLIRGVADTEVPQEQFLAIVDFLNTLRREGFTRGEVFLAAEQFATGTEGERIAGIILSGAGDRLAQAAADLVRQPTFRTAAEEEALRQSFAGRGRVETLLEEIRDRVSEPVRVAERQLAPEVNVRVDEVNVQNGDTEQVADVFTEGYRRAAERQPAGRRQ